MKIHELSKLSEVNVETIRMYRNKGLLKPVQNENGYYEYSRDDLQTLLYIRKLREMEVPLKTIAGILEDTDPDAVIAVLEREYTLLEEQIADLRRHQALLRVTIRHFESYQENMKDGVTELEIPDNRYDLIMDEEREDPLLKDWLRNIDLFTQGVRLPAEQLMEGVLPDPVPVGLTIGTYEPILRGHKIPIPKQAILIPKGRYLTVRVKLNPGRSLDLRELQPMLDYAGQKGYVFTGDSTAFLFRAARVENGTEFIYRLRAKVEKK